MREEKSGSRDLLFRLKSMLGPALVFPVEGGSFAPVFGCEAGSAAMSTSKSRGEVKSTETLRPLLTSKKSALRKAEKSSSTGAGSASRSWGGESWFKVAMYWDTLGPRCPL